MGGETKILKRVGKLGQVVGALKRGEAVTHLQTMGFLARQGLFQALKCITINS